MQSKGITPIVAVILIILISVSLGSLFAFWSSKTFEETGQIGKRQTEHITGILQKEVSVESVSWDGLKIYIKNKGTVTIYADELAVYVNDTLYDFTANDIEPDEVGTLTLTTPIPNGNYIIKVAAAGSSDSMLAEIIQSATTTTITTTTATSSTSTTPTSTTSTSTTTLTSTTSTSSTSTTSTSTSSTTTTIAWFDSNWQYRKKITIDHTKVGGDLTNFPILVSTTDTDLRDDAQDDGDDILFTTSDGTTQLDHEIEKFVGSTGELVVWVEIPSLSGSTDTEIYMYYGYSGASNQENPTGVWDSTFEAAWHMKENPTGGTGCIKDSTSNDNDGTPEGSMTSDDLVDGKIGKAIDFDGSNDIIRIDSSSSSGHSLDFTEGPFTIEAWVNRAAGMGTILAKRDDANDQYQFYGGNANHIQFRAGGEYGYAADGSTGNWYHWAVVVNASEYPELYVDSIQQTWYDSVGSRPYSFTHRDVDASIGARWSGDPNTGYQWNGIIDEVRISNTARSAGWLSTSYNTMDSPGTFLTFGSEESYS